MSYNSYAIDTTGIDGGDGSTGALRSYITNTLSSNVRGARGQLLQLSRPQRREEEDEPVITQVDVKVVFEGVEYHASRQVALHEGYRTVIVSGVVGS